MIFSSADDAPLVHDLFPDWAAVLAERAARAGGADGAAARAAAAAVELEIGSGHGGFALAFGRAVKDRALVAIEQRRKFSDELAAKADRRGHWNVVALCGDARLLAPRIFRAGSLAAIHVHFPDPWWKRRHHHRRLVDDGMSRLLLGLLAPGGLLDFRTDVERYAVEAIARLEEIGFANEAGRGRFAERPQDDLPSTREKRYLTSGEPVWRLRLRRP